MTTITLDHTLYTGFVNNQNPVPYNPQPTTQSPSWFQPEKTTQPLVWLNPRPTRPPVYQTVPPVQTQRPVQTQPPVQVTANLNPDRFADSDFECGKPDFVQPTSTGLIVGGRYAQRGQFPW